MRWCCGVFCGFILALAIGIIIFYFSFLKENPDIAAEGMTRVEEKWQETKDSGDRVIETIKPLVPQKSQGISSDGNMGSNTIPEKIY